MAQAAIGQFIRCKRITCDPQGQHDFQTVMEVKPLHFQFSVGTQEKGGRRFAPLRFAVVAAAFPPGPHRADYKGRLNSLLTRSREACLVFCPFYDPFDRLRF